MTAVKHVDRRVQRTRQLLLQASVEVMQEKGFSAISVQDIADRANVNRGTFYAHFEDKYALLHVLIREEFHKTLGQRLPAESMWDRRTVLLLIQTVLEYFAAMSRRCHLSPVSVPMFERATHEELIRLILSWLKQNQSSERQLEVPLETIAQVVSWAIFGAAINWSHGTTTQSAEQMANDVLLVVMAGVARFVSDAFIE